MGLRRQVTVTAMPINDGWLRDWGPTCVARADPETGKRQVAGVHWDYDCYGEPPAAHPAALPRGRVAALCGMRLAGSHAFVHLLTAALPP